MSSWSVVYHRTKRRDLAIDVCRLDMLQLTACADDSRIKCRFSLPWENNFTSFDLANNFYNSVASLIFGKHMKHLFEIELIVLKRTGFDSWHDLLMHDCFSIDRQVAVGDGEDGWSHPPPKPWMNPSAWWILRCRKVCSCWKQQVPSISQLQFGSIGYDGFDF